jgi:hypothetical protein
MASLQIVRVQLLMCAGAVGATLRKVAGSIPDGVIEIFIWYNPSDRIVALGPIHPATEMSTSNIYWGEGGVSAAGA